MQHYGLHVRAAIRSRHAILTCPKLRTPASNTVTNHLYKAIVGTFELFYCDIYREIFHFPNYTRTLERQSRFDGTIT